MRIRAFNYISSSYYIIVITSPILFWLYSINRISMNLFLFAEISISLALIALLLPPSSGTKPFTVRLPFSLCGLPVAVYVVAEAEILRSRHTGFGYVIALALALLITALAEEKPAKKVAIATAIVGVSLIPLFSLYVPSFGNDTWRDVLWAAQAIQMGHVTETAVKQSIYPFPVVPLEYALMSLVSELDPAWVSVVIGARYYGVMEPQTIALLWAGNYGLYVDPSFLKTFRGYLIFRPTSLDMPRVFTNGVYDVIRRGETSIVINGRIILAVVGSSGS
jgi:hypothetical protein